MMEKIPMIIFSRPLTYFGSPQNIEKELDEFDEEEIEFMRFGPEMDLLYPFQQNIGLFIHWSDFS